MGNAVILSSDLAPVRYTCVFRNYCVGNVLLLLIIIRLKIEYRVIRGFREQLKSQGNIHFMKYHPFYFASSTLAAGGYYYTRV